MLAPCTRWRRGGSRSREDGVVVDEFVGGFVRDGEVLRLAEVAVNRVQGAE